MTDFPIDRRGFFEALAGDGRPLLLLTGVMLALAGGFALFQSATGQFLPQDVAYLGMTAADLCGFDQGRIVHFMFHDRVAFGGSLIALGSLYLWLAEFPLRHRQSWAWWLFLTSGTIGFATFLAYLGYGYLDTWHGVATLALLPVYSLGMVRSRKSSGGWDGIVTLLHWLNLHGKNAGVISRPFVDHSIISDVPRLRRVADPGSPPCRFPDAQIQGTLIAHRE